MIDTTNVISYPRTASNPCCIEEQYSKALLSNKTAEDIVKELLNAIPERNKKFLSPYYCFGNSPKDLADDISSEVRAYFAEATFLRQQLDNYIRMHYVHSLGVFSNSNARSKYKTLTFSHFLKLSGLDTKILIHLGMLTERPLYFFWALKHYLNTGTSTNGVTTKAVVSPLAATMFENRVQPDVGTGVKHFYVDGNNNCCYDESRFLCFCQDLEEACKETSSRAAVDKVFQYDFFEVFSTQDFNINTEPSLAQFRNEGTTTVQTTQEDTAMEQSTKLILTDNVKNILNAVLSGVSGAPNADEIVQRYNQFSDLQAETNKLKTEVSRLVQQQQQVVVQQEFKGDGTIPNGKSIMIEVATAFPQLKKLNINFQVPAFEWDNPHPHVPTLDDKYIFRTPILLPLLMALASGENIWLSGHTGSGKTTLIEQVCARLNYPLIRIAFDHAIDRYELMGSTTLISDGKGGTQSKFNPGILEQTVPNGYVLLCDELDCARPDSLYVMQDILEHKTKFVLEANDDSGTRSREIKFNPLTRIIATGNTKGNGDQFNLYPACRTLSAATLDRFTTWIEVKYMSAKQESDFLQSHLPGTKLGTKEINGLVEFGRCMRDRFINGTIPVSYSPRRSLQFAKKVNFLMSMNSSVKFEDACRIALQAVVLASADKDCLEEISSLAQVALGINQSTSYESAISKLK